MKLSLFHVALLFAWAPPAAAEEAQSDRVLTLSRALEEARARQPRVLAAKGQAEAAKEKTTAARAPLLPTVAGNLGYQRTTGNFALRPGSLPSQTQATSSSSFRTFNYFTSGVSVNQLLWDFGKAPGRWRAAEASARALEAATRTAELDTTLQVRTAFFDARAKRALFAVAKEALANAERHVAQAEALVKVGTRPEIELLQARTERANARVSVIQAENAYALAKARLNLAMGFEGGTDYEVADETIGPLEEEDQALEPLFQAALAARPELRQLAEQAEAEQQALRTSRGGYFPNLVASTGVTDVGTELDKLAWNWNAQLSLNWTLFDGLATPAEVRAHEASLRALAAELDGVKQALRVEVDEARRSALAARSALLAAGEAEQTARERLKLAEGRYQTGVGSAIELGDAQLATNNAAAQRVRAELDLADARAALLKALGRSD